MPPQGDRDLGHLLGRRAVFMHMALRDERVQRRHQRPYGTSNCGWALPPSAIFLTALARVLCVSRFWPATHNTVEHCPAAMAIAA